MRSNDNIGVIVKICLSLKRPLKIKEST